MVPIATIKALPSASLDDHYRPMTQDTISARKARASAWFQALQDKIIADFEALESDFGRPLYRDAPGQFERIDWQRGDGSEDLGGGRMAILRGRVFEKAGVHTSEVYGEFSEAFRAQIPGADASEGRFWAAGISLIVHPRNPRVPAVHMNTRMLVTSESWFGGGADLTPLLADQRSPDTPDAKAFHAALKTACDKYDPAYYPDMRDYCDRYFHLAHRDEPRGIGGIFYDRHNTGDWETDFAFTKDVGEAFRDAYLPIARERIPQGWTEAEREAQLIQRGRYVEFNLLYDRGTTFGLKTGGNVHSILSSMPPVVKWP